MLGSSQSRPGDDEPQAFVRWAQMPSVLEQANTNGVRSTLLLKDDGALLALAGESRVENIVGVLVAKIWETYTDGGRDAYDSGPLRTILIACDDGQLAVTRVGRFLVCLYADVDVPAGALRAKLRALEGVLAEPLGLVFPDHRE